MTLKSIIVVTAAMGAATTSALAHPGAHSHADATASAAHMFSSVFHMGPALVALLVAFYLYRQAKKPSDNA
ncbi:MAG: hypothetical protein WA921_01035 [Ahrensia sp.]